MQYIFHKSTSLIWLYVTPEEVGTKQVNHIKVSLKIIKKDIKLLENLPELYGTFESKENTEKSQLLQKLKNTQETLKEQLKLLEKKKPLEKQKVNQMVQAVISNPQVKIKQRISLPARIKAAIKRKINQWRRRSN